ncbi:hypothetical protein VitviT2T_028394 [Vitis vinifera]|uniref:Uncharacterized protein n=1 Tax=Vitis vinifera TaxID=29760 RepID=A0ABY9DT61_VITVI|nr:hypothetical protein VitviT2T_028394 [Vitis vinifera]
MIQYNLEPESVFLLSVKLIKKLPSRFIHQTSRGFHSWIYISEVIFADGTSIDGSTCEPSCDGLLREPFAAFCQGGSHCTQ